MKQVLIAVVVVLLVIAFLPLLGPAAFVVGILGAMVWAISWWVGLANGLADSGSPARRLQLAFERLGSPVGKTDAEIISVVGPPASSSEIYAGTTLMTWQVMEKSGRTLYFMALTFKDGLCTSLVRESVNGYTVRGTPSKNAPLRPT